VERDPAGSRPEAVAELARTTGREG